MYRFGKWFVEWLSAGGSAIVILVVFMEGGRGGEGERTRGRLEGCVGEMHTGQMSCKLNAGLCVCRHWLLEMAKL